MRTAIRTTLAGAALALVATMGGTAAHAKPIGPHDPGVRPPAKANCFWFHGRYICANG